MSKGNRMSCTHAFSSDVGRYNLSDGDVSVGLCSGGHSIVTRFLTCLKLIVEAFIEKDCYTNVDTCLLQTLIDTEQYVEAYYYCSRDCNPFAVYSKPLLFIDGRDVLSVNKEGLMRKHAIRFLESNVGWIHSDRNHKHLYRYMKTKTDMHMISSMTSISHADQVGNGGATGFSQHGMYFSNCPSMIGQLFHSTAFEYVLPTICELLIDVDDDVKEIRAYLPGRLINSCLFYQSSTPDCVVSTVTDEQEYVHKLCSDIQRTIESKKSLEDQLNEEEINKFLDDDEDDDENDDVNKENIKYNSNNCKKEDESRESEYYLCHSHLRDRLRVGCNSRLTADESHTIAYMELKTLTKANITPNQIEFYKSLDCEQKQKQHVLDIIRKCLVEGDKMPYVFASRKHKGQYVNNAFTKGTYFVPSNIMGQRKFFTQFYPSYTYTPMNYGRLQPLPWSEVFPVQRKAISILFDVTDKDNKPLDVTTYEGKDVPFLLTPQCSYGMQMLEQRSTIGREATGIFVAMVKGQKKPATDIHDGKEWEGMNRFGLIYAITIEFNDICVRNMESLLHEIVMQCGMDDMKERDRNELSCGVPSSSFNMRDHLMVSTDCKVSSRTTQYGRYTNDQNAKVKCLTDTTLSKPILSGIKHTSYIPEIKRKKTKPVDNNEWGDDEISDEVLALCVY